MKWIKHFRRTKLPKIRVGSENFVRRKFCPPKFCPIRYFAHLSLYVLVLILFLNSPWFAKRIEVLKFYLAVMNSETRIVRNSSLFFGDFDPRWSYKNCSFKIRVHYEGSATYKNKRSISQSCLIQLLILKEYNLNPL